LNKNINETQLKDDLLKSYKTFDPILCISDCSRFDYCNLISLNKTSNICKYYFVYSFNQSQLIDSQQGLKLFYIPPSNAVQIKINLAYQDLNYLKISNSNINKTKLTFYELINMQRQDAANITFRGSPLQPANITSRRIYFSDGNWYNPFYIPYWPTYGEILYIEVNSGFSVTINKARTNLMNNLVVSWGNIALFVNDLKKWKFIAIINRNDMINFLNRP
jgi:hypothetical protein